MLAFLQMRHATGELDYFDTARDFALGIRKHFAVFAGDQARQLVAVLVQQGLVFEQDTCAAQRRGGRPRRERGLGGGNGRIDVGGATDNDLGLLLAGGGVVDRAAVTALPGGLLTVDEVLNLAHDMSLILNTVLPSGSR